MKLKIRKKPLALQVLDALQFRLRANHPQLPTIQHDAAKRMKGYIGEQKVDYHIEQQLPNSYTILHDVCLLLNGSKFNIDTLILSNHAIYIIETKHFNGKIIFNTVLDQFTRIDSQGEKGYRNPITQAKTQQQKLDNWLSQRNIHDIPIHYFVAVSDPSTIIDVVGDAHEIAKVVSHAEHLPNKIMQLDTKIRNKRQQQRFNGRQLGEKILRECTELDIDAFAKFNIKKSEILPGVHCPSCKWLGMKRKYGKWHCNKCGYISKNAHLKALADYFLLIKKSISNKECIYFLNLHSRGIATRILKTSNLVYSEIYRRWFPKGTFSAKQKISN